MKCVPGMPCAGGLEAMACARCPPTPATHTPIRQSYVLLLFSIFFIHWNRNKVRVDYFINLTKNIQFLQDISVHVYNFHYFLCLTSFIPCFIKVNNYLLHTKVEASCFKTKYPERASVHSVPIIKLCLRQAKRLLFCLNCCANIGTLVSTFT